MRVVILGGGYAGLICALRLARRTRGQVAVTLVSASPWFVDRIRLHERAAGSEPVKRELAEMVAGTGITLKIGRVTRIDPRGEVLLGDERLPFEQLVVALGSHVDLDGVPGVREHAFTLDAASAASLSERLPAIAARKGRVVVVGGGLTGIEGASELAEAHPGLQVTLLYAGDLGGNLSEAGREHLRRSLNRLGVTLEQGRVKRLQAGSVELEDRSVPFDACLWAGGFVAPELLRQSGLSVNARGQVLVDSYLRALGHENLHVIGDAAAPVDPPSSMLMGCKTAMPMGVYAAERLSRLSRGQDSEPFDYMDVAFCISLGRRDGLVQPYRHGSPTGWVFRNRLGAWLKEAICLGVSWTLAAERKGLSFYAWTKTGRKLSPPAAQEGRLAA
ncbi:NAD(P)/FAD-dependent oxidoreductase [Vitiosangium sp. GDMCC 1.1324]|uniref:NAD(P)/FAD-dependent oxidoreductase n=1 Tax=Vitiosangium sp. (strain GDMCC 1.1324) TaxID=2138576 RepID=UPI000D370648|nr:FAD-dependent oxidoreductase [Vitiosangium sp. GDMCC 1.1324]PTL83396.1 NADH-quinone oxidoreductase subunit L [Vitiosangium sp. GDMCC 1.1324]